MRNTPPVLVDDTPRLVLELLPGGVKKNSTDAADTVTCALNTTPAPEAVPDG